MKKTFVSMVSGMSMLVLAATCAPALAHGFGHRRGDDGDRKLGLLAHAAGLTGSQIHAAFKGDANLKTDFANYENAKKAMGTCIVAGTCTNEVATYASAQQALTQEKMTVWQNLFKGAPNKANAATVMGQLDSLKTQQHQIMHQVFGSAQGSDTVTPPTVQQ